MQKIDVQIALEKLCDETAQWNAGRRQFNEALDKVLARLVHEGARAFMSDREMAKSLGWTTTRMRTFMRHHGLNPRDGKRALSAQAAEALTTNAALLGIDPSQMDLTSPLAYLPMGKQLADEFRNGNVSKVHEEDVFPETEAYETHRAHCTANTCCLDSVRA